MRVEDFIAVTILGCVVAISALYYSRQKSTNHPDIEYLDKTEYDMSFLSEPEAPEDNLGRDCVVLAPWGETIIVRFSAKQWRIVLMLSKMTGDSVKEVVCEIASDRYEQGGEGLIPPPPWLSDIFDDDDDLF